MKATRAVIFVVLIVTAVAILVMARVIPPTALPQDASPVIASDEEDSAKATVLRLINEGFNQGNSGVASEIYAPDYVGHIPENPIIDSTLDVNKVMELIDLMGAAFPNLHIESEILIQEGNIVGNRAILRGDFLSEFYDVPPTESSIELSVNVFHRFNDNGQIVEEWIEFDTWDVMQQLGIDPLSS
jgi:predicted ester cyclase